MGKGRSDPSSDLQLAVFLAWLFAFHAVILLVLLIGLSEQQLAKLELSSGLCLWGSIAILAAGSLMVERASAARRSQRTAESSE